MLRSTTAASPSAHQQPDLPPQHQHQHQHQQQHRRGSSYQTFEKDGYQPFRQQQTASSHHHSNNSIAPSPPSPPPQRRAAPTQPNLFTAPRPSLLPYQEYHSGFFSDDDLGGAGGSTSPYAYSSPSTSTHRRQQSFTNLLPAVLKSRTPSPIRKTPASVPEDMPYTGDGRSPSRTAAESSPRGGFAGWLSGSAAGSALGSYSPGGGEQQLQRAGSRQQGQSTTTTPDVTPTRLRKNTASSTIGDPTTPRNAVTTTASRFMTALSTRLASSQTVPSAPNPSLDDDLYNLNVEAALFPPGSPRSDRDAFSPAAFKNLQTNATGLLVKMQSAYRQKCLALRESEAERAALRDEHEEAVTRTEHLRMQLEGMARRAAEQEVAMGEVMGRMMGEKRAREEERIGRERAARMVGESGEDLGVDERGGFEKKSWRRSGGTVKSDGTGSYDTDDEEESVDESVFSRSRSPTVAPSTVDGSVVDGPTGTGGKTVVAAPARGRNSAQMSTFQKIFKGIAGDVDDGKDGCRNCKGMDASVAWDTVSLLRDENKHLKQRVGQLEVAVEGALDLVNGLGL